MKKEYWIILIVYTAMQLSSFVGVPILMVTGGLLGKDPVAWEAQSVTYWVVISFTIATAIILFILRKEMVEARQFRDTLSTLKAFFWAFIGVFLALFAQAIAANIERLLGIEMGSENTKQIIQMIEAFPLVIMVSSVLGPILEEIVFRKIIFGSLHKRFNFFISAIISSIVFALAHFEPEHVLLYSAMGLTFAFLYVKTKRIWVPMVAHVAMNTFVVLVQSVFKEDIEKMIEESEKTASIIAYFL